MTERIELIASAEDILRNLETFQDEIRRSESLQARLRSVHAWYIDPRRPGEPRFGFSKFLGYRDLDAETYLENSSDLNGRDTERALAPYFDRLPEGSPGYDGYRKALEDWLKEFGRQPRLEIRLMILKPECMGQSDSAEDRHLLDLLIRNAQDLPAHQRRELRDSL